MSAPDVQPAPEATRLFRRRYPTSLRRGSWLIDPLAMLDLILLLVFFFMLQSRFILQPGIRVQLPEAPFAEGAHYSALVVTISQEGLVFFNDQRTTLEGLRSAFQQAVFDPGEARLILEADGRVPNEQLVAIYNMAAEAGLRDITLATRQPAPAGGRP